MNQWRSPTAEKIYSDDPRINSRSCGTSSKARRTVSTADIQWADLICVMETKHRQQLQSHFSAELKFKRVEVLNIPDEYRFLDPELIAEIQAAVEPLLA